MPPPRKTSSTFKFPQQRDIRCENQFFGTVLPSWFNISTVLSSVNDSAPRRCASANPPAQAICECVGTTFLTTSDRERDKHHTTRQQNCFECYLPPRLRLTRNPCTSNI
jgi:hypothetical protein